MNVSGNKGSDDTDRGSRDDTNRGSRDGPLGSGDSRRRPGDGRDSDDRRGSGDRRGGNERDSNQKGVSNGKHSLFSPDSLMGKLFGKKGNNDGENNSLKSKVKKGVGKKLESKKSKFLLVLGLIVLFGVFFTEKIPFKINRTPMENFNLFISNVEGTNQYPLNRERTGKDYYDKDIITPSMAYDMGHDHYYVYVYTLNEMLDKEFNEEVLNYMNERGSLPIYKLYVEDASDYGDTDLYFRSPKIIEMLRLKKTSIPVSEYYDKDSWIESYRMLKDK